MRHARTVAVVFTALTLMPEGVAVSQTLQDALNAAWLNNPALEAERGAAAIAEEQVEQARAQGLPTVSLFGSYVYESVDSNRPFAFNLGNRPVATAQLEARMPVYTGGRITAGIRQAEEGALAAGARLDASGQSILLDTLTAYVDIIRAREVISIRESSIRLLDGQYVAASDRFEVGDVTRTDVALSLARLEGGRAALASAEANLEASLARYALLTGLEANETLAPAPPLPDLPESFDEALAIALETNPDIQTARHAEQAARQAIEVARGALKPEVSVIAQAGVQEYHTDGFTDSSVLAGAQARVPLFTGGLNTSRLKEARLARERAASQIALSERLVRTQVAQAWYSYLAADRAVEASERQVEAAEIAYEGAQEELSVGVRTTLDVLDQEQQLLEARLSRATAARDRYVAAHQLLAAMGFMTPARLGLAGLN